MLNNLQTVLSSQYTIDYNDSSSVEIPVFLNSSSINLTHQFTKSGNYFVNVTVRNQVSSLSVIKQVFKRNSQF